MKLLVGLGNPGRKYEGTRHNVGFDVLDEIARRHAAPAPRAKFRGHVTDFTVDADRVLLLWPHTFMNLSGTSVGAACDFYHLATEDVLIICDDFHLPLGKLRFRASGSSGGQKGLGDILRRLGTEQVPRLRIGVGPLPEAWDPADFVLSKFRREEGAEIERTVARAADAAVDWIGQGMEVCMNRYN